jgi:multiple sugar transport system substrate-binding protein
MAGAALPVSAQDAERDLVVWDFQYESPGWGAALKELDASFVAANPGVRIEHVGQPFENYNQIVQAAFTSGSGPDVLMFLPGASGLFTWADGLETLTDRIDAGMRDRLLGWDAVSLGYDVSGDVVGIPVGLQGQVIYVNKALWAQAGLDPTALPTSHEELAAAVKSLREAGITPFASGNKEGWENGWWLNIFWPSFASQEDSFAVWRGEIPWTDPRMVDTLQPYLDLSADGAFDDGRYSTPLFPDGGDMFATGQGAMFLGLISADVSYAQFNPALGEENVGYFQAPSFGDGTPAFLPVGAQIAWAVPRFAQDKDLAWQYIQHITSPEAMQLQFDKGGVIPNDRTTQLGDAAPAQVLGFVADYGSRPVQLPMDAIMPVAVYDEFCRQVSLVLRGETSLEAALASVDEVAQRVIAEQS